MRMNYKDIEFKQCHRLNIECKRKKIINNLIQLDLSTIKLNQDSKIFDIQTPSLTEKAKKYIKNNYNCSYLWFSIWDYFHLISAVFKKIKIQEMKL